MALLKSINLAGNISTLPTKLSEFQNDAGFITASQIDLDNYYNKSETNALLAAKQDTLTAGTNIDITNGVISSTIDTTQFATTTALTDGLATKADADSVYTKTEADALLDAKADADSVYTKTEADALLDVKADANSVYTKTEADNLLDAKADKATTYTKVEVDNALADKADSDSVYTKSEVDEALADKADTTSVYTKTETDTLLNAKANSADVYTKTEADNLLDDKADQATTYTKTEVDNLISSIDTGRFEVVQQLPATGEDKVIYLVPNEGTVPNIYDEYIWVNNAFEKIGTTEIDLSGYYTSAQTDALLADKADKSTTYTKTETDTLLTDKADAATTYTKTEVDTALAAKADQATTYTKTEVDNLVDEKADASSVYTKSETDTLLADKANTADVYTKTQADTLLAGKQDTLTAGSNIQISNGTISATDTTYTAGNGLTLSGTEFSADTSVLATQTDLAGKQDTLTAGSHITIAQDGTISATGMTKQEILTELGYEEITLSTTTDQGTVTAHVLGYVDAPATPDYLLQNSNDEGFDNAPQPTSAIGRPAGTVLGTFTYNTNPASGDEFGGVTPNTTLSAGNSVKVTTEPYGDGYGGSADGSEVSVTGELSETTPLKIAENTFSGGGKIGVYAKYSGTPVQNVIVEMIIDEVIQNNPSYNPDHLSLTLVNGIQIEILDYGE